MKISAFLLMVLFVSVLSVPYIDKLFPEYGISTIIEGTVWILVTTALMVKFILRASVLLFSKQKKGRK